MKFIKHFVSLFLIITFLNVIMGKALHEFFEHNEEIHGCINKDETHFHEFKLQHIDVICGFNFLTNFLHEPAGFLSAFLPYHNAKIKLKYLWLSQKLYLENTLLRGPPLVK